MTLKTLTGQATSLWGVYDSFAGLGGAWGVIVMKVLRLQLNTLGRMPHRARNRAGVNPGSLKAETEYVLEEERGPQMTTKIFKDASSR